jgi:hypothetical protein
MLRLIDGAVPEKEVASTTAYKGVDAIGEVTGLLTSSGNILMNILSKFNEKAGFSAILNATRELDTQSSNLIKAMGVSTLRGGELTQLVADTIPRIVGMGIDAGEAVNTYTAVIDTFDTSIMLSTDTIAELAATTKVTGQTTKELSEGFRGVGVSINDVGERMREVADVANQAGVTTSSVSAGVVKNLDKMNIYNFEGGVKGLAKMAAQASRLGIDMNKIFEVTDRVFNPEGAIEMAAGLQRLGVASSEMLDPLRLMDLAQNDPEELQNQIVNLSKEFTVFNKQTNQFEILPGAKRRMQEIGKELGMTGGEFQKMSLNAANFDMKLKQIKFAPDIADADREMIATMATIGKEGEATVRVKEVKDGKDTGEFIEKAISQLNPEDIKLLKDQQSLQGATMEEIAHKQLSEQQRLNSSIDKFLTTIQYGLGTSEPVQKVYTGSLRRGTGAIEGITPESVKNVRQAPDDIIKMLESQGFDLSGVADQFFDWSKGFVDQITTVDVVGGIRSSVDALIGTITSSVSPAGTTISPVNSLTATAGTTPSTPTTTNIAMTHTFDFINLPSNANTEDIQRLLSTSITDWATKNITQDQAQNIVKVGGGGNNGLT